MRFRFEKREEITRRTDRAELNYFAGTSKVAFPTQSAK